MLDAASGVVQGDDFKQAHTDYLEMHKEKFKFDEEENELEHTAIHEGYVFLVENMLDEAFAAHDQATQNQFYDDFKNKFG